MPRKSDRPYKGKANLDVLFGEEESQTAPQTVPCDSITLPVSQPRRYFDPVKMEQLIESVKAHGVLENLLIRPLPDKDSSYELIAGERRYRAALAAGLKEVPVTIRSLTDEQALQISLVENLLREDLNPIEETEGILQLLALRLNVAREEVKSLLYRMRDEQREKVPHNVMGNEQGQTIQAVFEELGSITWESFVSNRLPLLNLPDDIKDTLQTGKIAYTKATALARLKDDEARQSLLEEAIEQDLSLSQIRERLKALQPKIEISSSPSSQFDATTHRLRAAKLWENPKKWKRVQTLLQKLEALAAVRSLISFGNKSEVLPRNVGALVELPLAPDTLNERLLTELEVQMMIALETTPRNRAILRLLYLGGLRASELCQLRWNNLQLRGNSGQVTVLGKGSKTRSILLPASLWVELMQIRGDAADTEPVFRSRKGSHSGHLTRERVHQIVKAAGKRAGIKGKVSPHWLRHAHATHALERGAKIHLVAETLGHSSVAVTSRYLHARPEDSSSLYLPG